MPSGRYDTLVRVADSREQSAASALAMAQKNLENHEARMVDLKNYWDEYVRRLENSRQGGIHAATILGNHAFMANLKSAIEYQESLIMAARNEVEARRKIWLKCHDKTRTAQYLSHQEMELRAKKMEIREQKEADERVTQDVARHLQQKK